MSRAASARKAGGDSAAAQPESSLSAALLLWLAWDLGIVFRSAVDAEDLSATNKNLLAAARLVAMAGQVAADEVTVQKAAEAVGRHCAYYEADCMVETWLEAHIGWMKMISEAAQTSKSASTRSPPDAGGVVYPKKGALRPMIVLQQRGRSVRVVDLDEADEQKGYGNEFITLVDI
jgi:hypothetical protein